MFTHKRRSIDLNGTWKFNPDPYMRCKQQRWWQGEGPDDAFFPCFNMDGLWDIQVPGTWKTQFVELKWYDGDANYVRDFEVPEIPDDHEVFLCFDGVIYSCNVYLNGEHVGDHDRGYSPFQYPVPLICEGFQLLKLEHQMKLCHSSLWIEQLFHLQDYQHLQLERHQREWP